MLSLRFILVYFIIIYIITKHDNTYFDYFEYEMSENERERERGIRRESVISSVLGRANS